jgi:predicted short-subunit dehydrogenase-like oxidoreductase (DUF2520 family)
MKSFKAVIIGSGNVASFIAKALQTTVYEIVQIYSRSYVRARNLAVKVGCVSYTDDLGLLIKDADIYILAVSDDALPEVISSMPVVDGLCVHTSGSVSIDVFYGYTFRYGVLYPLQTLSEERKLDFSAIPLFIEGNSEQVERELFTFASQLSDVVYKLKSDKRRRLHLAAVIANNFTNHLFGLAIDMLEKDGINGNVLLPLIDETVAKLHVMSPYEAQTGPAVRDDSKTLQTHLQMIENENEKQIYLLLSNSIKEHKINNDKLRLKENKSVRI